MALSKPTLRDRIISELSALGIVVSGHGGCRDADDYMLKWATAIANAVIDEIQANARAVGSDSDDDSHSLSIE